MPGTDPELGVWGDGGVEGGGGRGGGVGILILDRC